MAELKLTLIVARTTEQELAAFLPEGKPERLEKLAVAYLSKGDLQRLEISPGEHVKISSPAGWVVVKALEDPELPEGLIMIPKGFWASKLTPTELAEGSLLADRGIEVTVEKAEGPVSPPNF